MNLKDELIKDYSNRSKHSNYQVLPTRLKGLIGNDEIETRTRHERERLDYMKKHVDFEGKTVLDIGGNTGYFSFEIIDCGAKSAHLYEGNKEHADFARKAAETLKVDNLHVTNGYYTFSDEVAERYDVVLLLNVLHHIGDDYGDAASIDVAKELILEQLNGIAEYADMVIFQLGFNWHGNSRTPLFDGGTKKEVIDYLQNGVAGTWDIQNIGIPQNTNNGLEYAELNNQNIVRDDSLGEFLNRPLFIMRSRKTGGV